MPTSKTIILETTHSFRHSAEKVFDAWLDPVQARRFMFTATEEALVRCDIDARPGGQFVMTDRRPDGDVEHYGQYIEVTHPNTLVFRFGIPAISSDFDLVAINIATAAPGCELTLTTELDPQWADYADEARSAWKKMLVRLEQVLEQKIPSLPSLCGFLYELDALKLINRRSYVGGGVRLENSAEHSWHLAMACWSVARTFQINVNEEKLIKLALVHDLGEIDAGDTFLYAAERTDAHVAEREGIRRLASHAGNGIHELPKLWEEQETGDSIEARLLKVVDRLLPFLLNVNSQGRAWQDHNIKRSQVLAAHAFIDDEFPLIHQWILEQLDYATAQGWVQQA